jgi:hypothetical protein
MAPMLLYMSWSQSYTYFVAKTAKNLKQMTWRCHLRALGPGLISPATNLEEIVQIILIFFNVPIQECRSSPKKESSPIFC